MQDSYRCYWNVKVRASQFILFTSFSQGDQIEESSMEDLTTLFNCIVHTVRNGGCVATGESIRSWNEEIVPTFV
jgi:hypothetical protein